MKIKRLIGGIIAVGSPAPGQKCAVLGSFRCFLATLGLFVTGEPLCDLETPF